VCIAATMRSRTQECIALLPTGNLTGSVKMWSLATNATVTRDQFKILPMPDFVVAHITSLAESEGYTRGIDPVVGPLEVDNDVRDMQLAAPLPDMMAIDGRIAVVQLANHYVIAPAAGVYDDIQRLGPQPEHDEGNGVNDTGPGLDDGDADAIAPAQLIQVAAPIYLLHRCR
jgi:hypothetical protein